MSPLQHGGDDQVGDLRIRAAGCHWGAFPVQGTRQPCGRTLALPRDHVAPCGSWACLLLGAVDPRTAQRSPTRWNSAGTARAPSTSWAERQLT